MWWPKTWLCCWHPISLLYSTISRLLPDRGSKALLWRWLSPISLLLRCWVALGEGWSSRILLLSRWWSPPLLRGPVTLLGGRYISLRRVTLLWWSVTWLLLTYKDSTKTNWCHGQLTASLPWVIIVLETSHFGLTPTKKSSHQAFFSFTFQMYNSASLLYFTGIGRLSSLHSSRGIWCTHISQQPNVNSTNSCKTTNRTYLTFITAD